jgi:hypothetical protein
MVRSKLALALCLFAMFSAFQISSCYSWSNGGYSPDPFNPKYGTHDWVAEHALDWLPEEARRWIVANKNWYLYGTELPDNEQAPDGIGDTQLHHVYFSADGSLIDGSSAVRANTTYRQALSYLVAEDYEKAAKYAGAMTHYISDAAVFGHVMGANTPWGAEAHHSDYESYVNSRTSSYFSEFNAYLFFDGRLETITAYEATIRLAYDTTFDSSGKGLTCIWMDQNYNWSNPVFKKRAGESLSLAVNLLTDVLYTLYLEYQAALLERFNFTIAVTSSNISVVKGGSFSIAVDVVILRGEAQEVSFSLSGLPAGATYVLNPPSGKPPFTSRLTITVPEEAPAGTYLVTLRGVGGGLSRTVTFRLSVAEPDKDMRPLLLLAAILMGTAVIIVVVVKLRKRR